jgi:hypothetical protein
MTPGSSDGGAAKRIDKGLILKALGKKVSEDHANWFVRHT